MKKIFGAFLVLALLLCSSTAFAADNNKPAVAKQYSNPSKGYCWNHSVDSNHMVSKASNFICGNDRLEPSPEEENPPYAPPNTPVVPPEDPESRPNTPDYDSDARDENATPIDDVVFDCQPQ